MGYLYLILTIITESAAIIFMKQSDGFQHRLYALAAVLCYGTCFVFLTLALKQLPAGVTNAVWAGASALLVAGLSYHFLHEKFSLLQMVSIGLIAAGLIGLNVK